MTGERQAFLAMRSASARLRGRRVLEDVSLSVARGELVCVMGPNGAGKTSLVRALLGLLPLDAGEANVAGRPARSYPPAERARTLAYLPQARPVAWPVTVREIVQLGRFAHGRPLAGLSAQDAAAVETAMERAGVSALADRTVTRLSGGETARVHLARSLAAEAPGLIVDEPVAALDLAHQWKVMEVLKASAASGQAVLAIVHDLALAANFADRIVLMKAGRIVGEGPPRAVLTPQAIREVFGVSAALDWRDGGVALVMTGA